jgi:lysozyme
MTKDQLKASLKKWQARLAHAKKMVARRKAQLATGKPVPAKGIDVSSYQGRVDWRKVKAAGYTFAWVKATEGTDFLDSTLKANVTGAKAAGVTVGAYHFLRPRGDRTGAAEARWFAKQLQAVGLGAGDLRPVLDVEETKLKIPATLQYVSEAVAELERLGYRPVLYTFPAFVGDWPARFARLPLWIANPDRPAPTVPKPWASYAAWQYSFKGHVPGITGDVDLNTTPNLKELVA